MNNRNLSLVTLAILAVGGLSLASCSGDDPAGPPAGLGNDPTAVTVASGNSQTGRTLETLDAPLVVRVADADGDPVSGATVNWSIAQGGGSLSAASSTSNAQGQASIQFTPGTAIETSGIEARVTGVATAASFTIETSILVIEIEGIAFVGPNGTDAVTIPLGATVEWVNRDAVRHTATSNSMPAGSPMINSGLMAQGARYSFTPNVVGTWTYFCEVHPAQMAGATVTVQ
ncbi:MAG: Ig-like domain-containing protein [Gemmatimonadetes bacterium]|nr:Ig-like domain-containing protein [Gemmatimonadota bacterium]